jgi:hypothetical protein
MKITTYSSILMSEIQLTSASGYLPSAANQDLLYLIQLHSGYNLHNLL